LSRSREDNTRQSHWHSEASIHDSEDDDSVLTDDAQPREQPRHVHEFSEVFDDILTEKSTSTNKPLPPKLIRGGLPPIPAKLVKRIEKAELLAETLISPEYTVYDQSTSSKQKLKEVTNITDWVQCVGLFIAIISLKESHRIPDLIGYQNLIMRSSV